MKYLTNYKIELGDFEFNEDFSKNGGWINGQLINTVTGESFSVGGGWIHNEEGANHYNNCHGYSYSGGGPNPYKGAMYAGGFESYRGNELGDVDAVYSALGFDEEESPRECEEILDEIIKLNNKAWADYDLSDNVEYQTLIHTEEEIIDKLKSLIEDNDDEHAELFGEIAELKGIEFSIEESWENKEEIAGNLYKTVERKLIANSEEIASWTICACGFYVDKRSNPNYSIGWNVDESTEGGDGIDYSSALGKLLKQIGLWDEATELPDIDEPEHEEPSKNGAYQVQLRNTYTQGMEDWETVARFETEKGARDYEAQFWRDFYSANSDNSYGPEIQIVFGGETLEDNS